MAIRYEMIHETRIIPLDAKPRVNEAIKMYMGDARGRFEGDILSAARAEERAIAEARAKGQPEPKFNNDDGPIFAPARE